MRCDTTISSEWAEANIDVLSEDMHPGVIEVSAMRRSEDLR